jgi:hypothetical protein
LRVLSVTNLGAQVSVPDLVTSGYPTGIRPTQHRSRRCGDSGGAAGLADRNGDGGGGGTLLMLGLFTAGLFSRALPAWPALGSSAPKRRRRSQLTSSRLPFALPDPAQVVANRQLTSKVDTRLSAGGGGNRLFGSFPHSFR